MNVGVDIGGTKTLVASFDNGQIVKKAKFATKPDYKIFVANLIDEIKKLGPNVEAIKIGAAGRVDRANGVFVAGGNLTWRNTPLGTDLKSAFGVPVKIENDANTAALHESIHGAGKDFKRLIYITLSTGIGSGFVEDKKLVESLLDEEIGQTMVRWQDSDWLAWEDIASGRTFYEQNQVLAKDCTDRKIWADYSQRLLPGFSAMLTLFQADGVVVGGSMAIAFDKFIPIVIQELEQQYSSNGLIKIPEFTPVSNPENAVLLGTMDL